VQGCWTLPSLELGFLQSTLQILKSIVPVDPNEYQKLRNRIQSTFP